MPVISISRLCKVLMLVVIASTPLFNVFEIRALNTGRLVSHAEVITPPYIKLIKDCFLLAVILLGFGRVLLRQRVARARFLGLFIFFAMISFLLSVCNQSIWLTFAGIRCLLPLAVFLSVYGIIDIEFQVKLVRLLITLLFIGFALQVYQLFFAGDYFGTNLVGLSERNPGFFIIPSSMALFSLIVMYYAYHYHRYGRLRNLVVYFIGPLSVWLTGSGTGIISLFLFIVTIAFFRMGPRWVVFTAGCGLLILTLVFLPKLTSRDDIYTSLNTRFRILRDVLGPGALLSSRFGYGTNTAVLLKRTYNIGPQVLITDCTFTAFIVSYGFVPLVFFVLFIAESVRLNLRMTHVHFIAIFVTFMATTIIFESFPANIIFSLNLAYFYKTRF